jgi:Protein of unknown function (DUF4245)
VSQASDTGQPSRYQRSFGGLIGSMIVLVLVVLGIVAFRGAFRNTPEYEPDHIDYRDLVVGLQQIGVRPVYPAELSEGWFAKASSSVADAPVFNLVFVAGDVDQTAGLHQEDASADSLVTTYVGESAREDGAAPLVTDLASWTSWTDTDGDHAYTAEIGDDTVLVYSSGDLDELKALVGSLTTAPLQP